MHQPRPNRLVSPAAVLAALLALAATLPFGAGVALAKEGLLVAFDAPIAFDTPPGTELLVGMTVTALADDGKQPVTGSPIVLILTGRDGSETEARGVEDTPGSGHYVARIAVPPGGARDARVVMRGTSSRGPSDIDLVLTTDPFTFGGVAPGTAQVAPAPTPALTPLPRASAPQEQPLAGVSGEEAAPGPATDTADGPSSWIPALVLVALGLAVVIAVRLRVARRPAQGT